jgi:hypothetical protein
MMLFVVDAQSQRCGSDFKTVKVLDKSGESIRDATIEIVAQLPEDEFKASYSEVTKIPASAARATIKRKLPMTFTKDIECENPLKQRRGKTKVKNIDEQKAPNTENFGFCTAETILMPLLLKVSAAGYATDYYVGNFLGGCKKTYEFVLLKKGEKS